MDEIGVTFVTHLQIVCVWLKVFDEFIILKQVGERQTLVGLQLLLQGGQLFLVLQFVVLQVSEQGSPGLEDLTRG